MGWVFKIESKQYDNVFYPEINKTDCINKRTVNMRKRLMKTKINDQWFLFIWWLDKFKNHKFAFIRILLKQYILLDELHENSNMDREL